MTGVGCADEFVEYARPLIGEAWPDVPVVGEVRRFARLEPVYADRKLESYVRPRYRS